MLDKSGRWVQDAGLLWSPEGWHRTGGAARAAEVFGLCWGTITHCQCQNQPFSQSHLELYKA